MILLNNLIELRELSKIPEDNYFISSLFIDKNDKRTDYIKYILGLEKWIEYLDDINNNRRLMLKIKRIPYRKMILFINENVKNNKSIMEKVNSSKYIIPVIYNSKKYNKYKWLGIMVVFMGAFNFENNPIKGMFIANIIISDRSYELLDRFLNIYETIILKYKTLMTFSAMFKIVKLNKNYERLNEVIFNKELLETDSDKYKVRDAIIFSKTLYIPDIKLEKEIFMNYINKDIYKNKDKGLLKLRKEPIDHNIDDIFLNNVLKFQYLKSKKYYIFNTYMFIRTIKYNLVLIYKNKYTPYYFYYIKTNKLLEYKKYTKEKLYNILHTSYTDIINDIYKVKGGYEEQFEKNIEYAERFFIALNYFKDLNMHEDIGFTKEYIKTLLTVFKNTAMGDGLMEFNDKKYTKMILLNGVKLRKNYKKLHNKFRLPDEMLE
jgi:hypothetical protein